MQNILFYLSILYIQYFYLLYFLFSNLNILTFHALFPILPRLFLYIPINLALSHRYPLIHIISAIQIQSLNFPLYYSNLYILTFHYSFLNIASCKTDMSYIKQILLRKIFLLNYLMLEKSILILLFLPYHLFFPYSRFWS